MALATGTSWGTMSILFPLIMVPTWVASNGDATIFYATTAGVLSGSVAGDHISPISDTTVLSALACDCKLLNHVATQAPYAVACILVSIFLGTIPIGYDAWPNMIGIVIGCGVLFCFVYFLCVPVISATGRFDILTELYMRFKPDSPLHGVKADTIKVFNGDDIDTSEANGDESAEPAKLLADSDEDTPEAVEDEKGGYEGDLALAEEVDAEEMA
jgi:hypothetical protein